MDSKLIKSPQNSCPSCLDAGIPAGRQLLGPIHQHVIVGDEVGLAVAFRNRELCCIWVYLELARALARDMRSLDLAKPRRRDLGRSKGVPGVSALNISQAIENSKRELPPSCLLGGMGSPDEKKNRASSEKWSKPSSALALGISAKHCPILLNSHPFMHKP